MQQLLAEVLRDERTDWPGAGAEAEQAFVEAACRHRVGPLVVRALERAGALDAWPAAVRTALARAAVMSGAVAELYGAELTGVLSALASAGLAPLLVKGAALAHTRYPEPYLRPRVDTDLFVRRDEAVHAGPVLEALGYERLEFVSGDLVSHQCRYGRSDRHGVRHVIDIHWKIANPQVFADLLGYDELAAEAVAVPALGPHARAVDGVAALVLACVHRVAHHHDEIDLLWLYDIHLLADGMDAAQARRLAALAAGKGVKAVCARGLTLARQWFATRLPDGLLEGLQTHTEEASEAYVGGRLGKLGVLMSDLKALHGWRPRWRLLCEHLVPSASYMRDSYGVASPALLPMLYVHRAVHGAWSWLRFTS